MRFHRIILTAALAITAIACVSPEEHYYQGQGYESSGNYVKATQEYLAALEGDRTFPGAREAATNSGNRAVGGWLGEAAGLESAGNFRQAAGRYGEIDGLSARASKVGVTLSPGADYGRLRRMTLDAAIDECIADASRYGSRNEWSKALDLYVEAADNYEPGPHQAQLLTNARYHTLLSWGEAELQAGNPRVALEKAEKALSIHGARSGLGAAAEDLRARAASLAQVFVAPTPMWRVEGLARRVPDRFLRDLDDSLAGDHWNRPPEFVSMVDLRDTRHELRNLHLDRTVLRESQAASLGKYLGANLVVVNYLDRFDLTERGVENRRTAAGPGGNKVEYTLFEGDRDLTARAAYRIISVTTRRVVRSGYAEVRESRPIRRGTYRGDVNRLKLSRGERAWFDARLTERIDEDLMRDAAGRLADKLAEEVYEELVKEIG